MSNYQPWTRDEIRDRLCAALRNTMLKQGKPVKADGPGDDLYDVSDAAAGEFHQAYGHAAGAVDEAFPQTSNYPHLIQHAQRYIGEPLPATKAAGASADHGAFRATGSIGATWTLGATFVHRDSGQRFRATAPGAIGGDETGYVPVEAMVAGDAGRLLDGAKIIWERTPTGINPTATVDGDMEGGTDAEQQDHYLQRYDDAIQTPDNVGTAGWFEWLLMKVPGVGDATCFRNRRDLGTGDVAILDMEGDPVSDAVLAAGQQTIDDHRQICADDMQAVRPVLVEVNLTFALKMATGFEFSGAPTSGVIAGSTAQTINVFSAEGYTVGEWVALRDLRRARKVQAINLPDNSVTLDQPLTDDKGQVLIPASGDSLRAGCPTYETLARAIIDLFDALRSGESYDRSAGEGALREIYEVVRPAQISPAGDVNAVVNPDRIEHLKLGELILQAAE